MLAAVVKQNNKPSENKKESIYSFILLAIFTFTLSLLSVLAFIFYLQFTYNRVIDLKNISEYFHTKIETILAENNIGYSVLNSSHTVSLDRKLYNYKEYVGVLSSLEDFDKVINSLRESFFRVGLCSNLVKNSESLDYLALFYDDLEISRVYFRYEGNKESLENSQILKKIVADTKVYFKENLPDSDILESLAYLESDSEITWPSKTITVISSSGNSKEFFANYKNFITSKYPQLKLELNCELEKIEVFYKSRRLLKIILTDNVFERDRINTSNISVKIPEVYVYFPGGNVRSLGYTNVEGEVEQRNLNSSYSFYPNLSSSYSMSLYDNELIDSYENDLNRDLNDVENGIPKVSIILDDGGFRDPNNDPALNLPTELIFSIIPDAFYARQLAEKAYDKGFQIMIHLPMQNKPGISKPAYSTELMINMKEEEIKERVHKACEVIPYAKGLNNHTGSLFTLKSEPVRLLAKVLKERKMFFVDSVVVPKSIAYSVMRKEGVIAFKRDVFLDHDYSALKIKERLLELKSIARKRGYAIGIGHFRDLTIDVLSEELPKFNSEGIKLVHIGEGF